MARTSLQRVAGVLLVAALALCFAAVAAPAGASASSTDDATAAASSPEQPTSLPVDGDGERYWIGQQLEFGDGQFAEGATVEFEHEDNFRQRTAEADGTVVVDTSGWATGDWEYEGVESGVSGIVTLSEQELETVAFESSDAAGESTFEVESNRAEFDLTLQSDDLDVEDVDAAFEQGSAVGDAYLIDVWNAEASVPVDTSELPPGTYEFEVDVVDATANSEATLVVDSSQEPAVSIDELDGLRYWAGQEIVVDGFEAGETVEFEHEDEFRQRPADGGTVTIATADWSPGHWSVEGLESGAAGDFNLSQQEIDTAVFEPEQTVDESTLHLDSNRAGYVVTLEADDLDAQQLAGAIDGADAYGDRVLLSVEDAEHTFDVDASALRGGEYEVEVDAVDSTAGDSAHLEVSAGLEFEGYHPLPYEGSDRYWDVTGDRSVTVQDLQAFFQHQHAHPVFEEHPEKFDFSDNGQVGQPDVIALFHALGDVPTSQNDDEADAEFVDGPFYVEEHETGTIELDVSGTDDAWVNVALSDADYEATVELTDLHEADDTVTIDADTFQMGHEAEDTFTGAHVAGFEETGDVVEEMQENDYRFDEHFSFRLRAFGEDPTQNSPTDVSALWLQDSLDGDVEFVDGPFDADEDGTSQVALDVEDSTVAWIEVAFYDGDYNATVELADLDDADGAVTVDVDTAELGHQTGDAFDGDHVVGYSESGALLEQMQEEDQQFDEWHSFRLYAGTEYQIGDDVQDVDRLRA